MSERSAGFGGYLLRLLGYSMASALLVTGAAALYACANPPLSLRDPDASTCFQFVAFFGCLGFWISLVPIGILLYPRSKQQ